MRGGVARNNATRAARQHTWPGVSRPAQARRWHVPVELEHCSGTRTADGYARRPPARTAPDDRVADAGRRAALPAVRIHTAVCRGCDAPRSTAGIARHAVPAWRDASRMDARASWTVLRSLPECLSRAARLPWLERRSVDRVGHRR